MDDQSNLKNTLVAIALSAAVLLAWDHFMVPKVPPQGLDSLSSVPTETLKNDNSIPSNAHDSNNNSVPTSENAGFKTLDIALENTKNRLPLKSDTLKGSINLENGRFDDLTLPKYYNELEKKSGNVRLFAPSDTEKGFFAEFGYTIGKDGSSNITNPWIVKTGDVLSDTQDVVLERQVGNIKITRTITLDENYMFTVIDNLTNIGTENISATPYALIKHNKPDYLHDSKTYAVHTGFIGWINNALEERTLDTIKDDQSEKFVSEGGWIGLTEKYWMATLIPAPKETIKIRTLYNPFAGQDGYQTDYVTKTQTIPPKGTITMTQKLFAGAKSVPVIEEYHATGIEGFDYTVDWGWFWYFTKPIFKGLLYIHHIVGNYGIAILLLTLVIKGLFFPLANKSYTAMSKMKKLQPEMEKIRSKFGDDPMKQQQELISLYKREKVNPVAGCWPLLLQIPVFYALYKVLNVALELRHAPFFGWIQDLSAIDPTNIFNLFGLLPFTPPSFLHVGILPLVMGITMWMQQKLNPASPDPVQARIMGFFPIIFTFILAPFAAGLVLYWTWNNILSILQQIVIMKRLGVPVEFRITKHKDADIEVLK